MTFSHSLYSKKNMCVEHVIIVNIYFTCVYGIQHVCMVFGLYVLVCVGSTKFHAQPGSLLNCDLYLEHQRSTQWEYPHRRGWPLGAHWCVEFFLVLVLQTC